VYRGILESSAFSKCLGNPETSLLLITMLKKLCNTPGLLDPRIKQQNENVQALLAEVNPKLLASTNASTSGKLRVLDRLVCTLKEHTDEKIVIVSNYTSTLNVLQNLLSSRSLSFLRLDGRTPSDKRQELVDRFNRVDNNTAFAFLLSAKSGGAGINLIGASRLVLFDLDWNPATDAQAMARIHRDGQKRPVMIYRMLTTGCFDEKIFQRQITKRGLADSVMDKKSGSAAFTQTELRDLFTLDETTDCQTHDLLACFCGGEGYIADTTPIPVTEDKFDGNNGDDNDDDDEALLPDPTKLLSGLVRASLVTDDMISGKAVKAMGGDDKTTSLGALMEYEHISTSWLVENIRNPDSLKLEDWEKGLVDSSRKRGKPGTRGTSNESDDVDRGEAGNIEDEILFNNNHSSLLSLWNLKIMKDTLRLLSFHLRHVALRCDNRLPIWEQ
jgi:DNA repair and recombination protein RAD54B